MSPSARTNQFSMQTPCLVPFFKRTEAARCSQVYAETIKGKTVSVGCVTPCTSLSQEVFQPLCLPEGSRSVSMAGLSLSPGGGGGGGGAAPPAAVQILIRRRISSLRGSNHPFWPVLESRPREQQKKVGQRCIIIAARRVRCLKGRRPFEARTWGACVLREEECVGELSMSTAHEQNKRLSPVSALSSRDSILQRLHWR